jgi:Ran GTPase-activating protein (RanGAP) involved in mRNA processing and transport
MFDEDMKHLLGQMKASPALKTLAIKQNIINRETAAVCQTLLKRAAPFNLHNFAIKNCKVSEELASNIVKALCQSAFLIRLELNNLSLSHDAFKLFLAYLEKSTLKVLALQQMKYPTTR